MTGDRDAIITDAQQALRTLEALRARVGEHRQVVLRSDPSQRMRTGEALSKALGAARPLLEAQFSNWVMESHGGADRWNVLDEAVGGIVSNQRTWASLDALAGRIDQFIGYLEAGHPLRTSRRTSHGATMDIQAEDRRRFLYLKRMYELTRDGTTANMWDVGRSLGFDRETTRRVDDYLTKEGLLGEGYLGGDTSISHLGIKEVETALGHPERPTQHFPANVYNITITGASNSPIQVGNTQSTQTVTYGFDLDKCRAWFQELHDNLEDLPFAEDVKEDLEATVQTAHVQLNAKKPNRVVLTEMGKSARNILEGATGSIVAQRLIELLPGWLG